MNQPVNNRMITLARESRGFTQKKLSELLKVSQGKISKVEQGLLGISNDMINDLEKVLNYPKNFFLESEHIYPPMTPFHRKRKRLSKKLQSMIEAKANIYRIHILKLQNAFDTDNNIIYLDLDEYDKKPENIAIALRYYWKLPKGPIENLTNIIENAGIIIIPFDFNTKLIDAFAFITPKSLPIIFVNINLQGDRLRFTLAHELGHIIMHQIPTLTMEEEANRFASEFLMPSNEIRQQLMRLTLPKIANLKPYWKVSMASLLFKAGKNCLNILTYNQERYLWQQMAPYRMAEPPKLDIPIENPSLLLELIEMYISHLGYSIPELLKLVNLFEDEFYSYYPKNIKHRHLRIA